MIRKILGSFLTGGIKKTDTFIKDIPISECVHFCGFKYGGIDYNPYQSYIVNRKNGVDSDVNKKQFIKFLRYYRPNDMAQGLSIDLKKRTPLWIYPWVNNSDDQFRERYNWFEDPDDLVDILTQFSEKGILSYRIDQEFYWLNRALRTMSEKKYQPEIYGYVNVLMLVKSNNKSAYLLLDGNHRVSSLYALGYDTVKVTIESINIIKEDEIEVWPGIQSGKFLKEDALKIFNRYFEGNVRYYQHETPANILNYSNDYKNLLL